MDEHQSPLGAALAVKQLQVTVQLHGSNIDAPLYPGSTIKSSEVPRGNAPPNIVSIANNSRVPYAFRSICVQFASDGSAVHLVTTFMLDKTRTILW